MRHIRVVFPCGVFLVRCGIISTHSNSAIWFCGVRRRRSNRDKRHYKRNTQNHTQSNIGNASSLLHGNHFQPQENAASDVCNSMDGSMQDSPLVWSSARWRFCKRVGCGVRAFNAEVSPNAYWLGSCCKSSVLRDAFASALSTCLLFAADAVE